jgi:hypothetical protein
MDRRKRSDILFRCDRVSRWSAFVIGSGLQLRSSGKVFTECFSHVQFCVNLPTFYFARSFQVWSISSNGEATELLSWFHGAAKFLKLIPSPSVNQNQKQDPFAHKRPLAAICDGGSSAQFCSINFLSLRGGDTVSRSEFLLMNAKRW